MNAQISGVAGRTPGRRNSWPPSGSHLHPELPPDGAVGPLGLTRPAIRGQAGDLAAGAHRTPEAHDLLEWDVHTRGGERFLHRGDQRVAAYHDGVSLCSTAASSSRSSRPCGGGW